MLFLHDQPLRFPWRGSIPLKAEVHRKHFASEEDTIAEAVRLLQCQLSHTTKFGSECPKDIREPGKKRSARPTCLRAHHVFAWTVELAEAHLAQDPD